MSTVTPDQGIVIPVGTDAANNPTAFVNMIAGVESRLVLRYTNLANRTALHTAPVKGQLTDLAAENRMDAYDGTNYISASARGRYARKMRTTNATAINNSTTLVNDAVLAVTLDTIGTFSLRGRIYYDGSTAGDIKMALTFPTVAANGAKWGLLGRNSATQTNVDAIVATASGTALAAGGTGVGTSTFFEFDGFLTTTATGTLQVQYAQNTLDATNLTVQFGSFIEVIRES